MALDLPPINNFIRQLQDRHRNALTEAVATSTRKIDRTLTALVKDVATPTREQVDVLIKQFRDNGNADQATRLLLQSPALKLVQLELEGKNVLTFTDKAPALGKEVEITKSGEQWLLRLNQHLPTSKEKGPLAPSKSNVLSASTRNDLPIQKPLSETIELISRIIDISSTNSRPPSASNIQSWDSSLVVLLKTIQGAAKRPEQLATPAELKQSIANSGVFSESKVHNFLKTTLKLLNSKNESVGVGNTDNRFSMINVVKRYFFHQELKPNNVQQQANLTHLQNFSKFSNQTKVDRNELISTIKRYLAESNGASQKTGTASSTELLSSDSKLLLQQIKERLEKLMQNTGYESSRLFQQLNASRLDFTGQSKSAIDALLQQWLKTNGAGAQKSPKGPVVKQQLMQLLHNQVTATLARIQLQQTTSLSHQLAPTEPGNQQFTVDIPIKFDDCYKNLELEFEQDWVEKEPDDDSPGEKTRRWNVLLNFDLPEIGLLYARVRSIEDKISVDFWAQHSSTLERVQNKLPNLNRDLVSRGVCVNEMQCLPGVPPKRTIQFDFALVDVKT